MNTILPEAWAQGETDARDSNPAAHVRCDLFLEKMAADKNAIAGVIATNDVQALREHLLTVRVLILRLRECMNTAMLTGAWKSRELGPQRFGMLDRLETLDILNTIGLSFTSPYYANPLGTVSGSVSDSVNRFFIQMEYLRELMRSIEKKA